MYKYKAREMRTKCGIHIGKDDMSLGGEERGVQGCPMSSGAHT